MKILVIYYSKTNNTKEIAESIYTQAEINNETTLMNLKDYRGEDLNNFDLIFAGAACHDANIAKPMINFLSNLPSDGTFKLAGFYTHSTVLPEGTERNIELFDRWAGLCAPEFKKRAENKNIELLGTFNCQSKASFLIEKFIRFQIIKDKKEWIPYRKEMRIHPTEDDFVNAKNFSEQMINSFKK